MKISVRGIFYLKVVIHLSAIATLTWLAYLVDQDLLGADPVKELTHFLGKTALNFLLLSLAITPVIKRFKQPLLIRVRRLLGLYSFAWVSLHLLVFIWLDLQWEFLLFFDEVIKRPYLSFGAVALIILLLLSITSITAIKKKMKKSWLTLHRFVYWAALFATIHYYWSVKSGLIEPTIYLAICFYLLSERKQYFRTLLKFR
ncbi:protein-methionine-sulfoxide reductase heme-binding subunit MsrQ [Psychromonas sp. Urea-02u-13]|uniref:protein-methionine-sulfoxide reductase heme-binding subunit MsrQ n=1 Tax=Psychromonas sp. Urea-02u-13 TaxID=2058326 RepID=UPI000C32A488|nr:protein-methionine-sulfoxide reductase heme-binding subunit MsrQ [Psychromonas sp. Urea-02u-13]PKG38076.1 sulfoxide reductase heme-binding subunit YedZ [Psychromonas sp. Urea-02u-13]